MLLTTISSKLNVANMPQMSSACQIQSCCISSLLKKNSASLSLSLFSHSGRFRWRSGQHGSFNSTLNSTNKSRENTLQKVEEKSVPELLFFLCLLMMHYVSAFMKNVLPCFQCIECSRLDIAVCTRSLYSTNFSLDHSRQPCCHVSQSILTIK